MNKILIYEFPEKAKEIYQKHFPEDKIVTYGNLLDKIDSNLFPLLINEEDEIPSSNEEVQNG